MEVSIDEARSAFCLFDRQKKGSLAQEDVGTVLRCLGFTPSEAQVKQMLSQFLKVGTSERLKLKDFLVLVKQQPVHLEEEELLEAFATFDPKRSGQISAEQLWSIVTERGEALSKEEVADMMKQAHIDKKGQVNYRDFVRKMCDIREGF